MLAIEHIIRYYSQPNEEIYSQWKQEHGDDLRSILQQLDLFDYSKRGVLVWDLQLKFEKVLVEFPSLNNTDIADIVAQNWNIDSQLRLNKDTILSLMAHLSMKDSNSQKSFLSLCKGDLKSYFYYTKNVDQLTELYIRFLITALDDMKPISSMVNSIVSVLKGASAVEEVRQAFHRMDLIRWKDKKVNFAKMKAYKHHVNINELVFTNGLIRIYLENANAIKEINEETSLLFDALQSESQNTSSASEKVKVQIQSETRPEPINQETATLSLTIRSLANKVLDAVSQIEKLEESTILLDPTYIQRLEEENKRLVIELEKEKVKAQAAGEESIVNLLNGIAGKSGGYLLSDLLEESRGNLPQERIISTGRLVNLFSMLSLFGIEEYTAGYQLHEQIIIPRDKLAKTFMISGPIRTDAKEIPVRMIRCGWALNDKVMIQPLVEEIQTNIS